MAERRYITGKYEEYYDSLQGDGASTKADNFVTEVNSMVIEFSNISQIMTYWSGEAKDAMTENGLNSILEEFKITQENIQASLLPCCTCIDYLSENLEVMKNLEDEMLQKENELDALNSRPESPTIEEKGKTIENPSYSSWKSSVDTLTAEIKNLKETLDELKAEIDKAIQTLEELESQLKEFTNYMNLTGTVLGIEDSNEFSKYSLEERVQYLQDIIDNYQLIYDSLNQIMESKYGKGFEFSQEDFEKVDVIFDVFDIYWMSGVNRKDMIQTKDGEATFLNIESLTKVLGFCNSTGIFGMIENYLNGDSWKDSGLQEFMFEYSKNILKINVYNEDQLKNRLKENYGYEGDARTFLKEKYEVFGTSYDNLKESFKEYQQLSSTMSVIKEKIKCLETAQKLIPFEMEMSNPDFAAYMEKDYSCYTFINSEKLSIMSQQEIALYDYLYHTKSAQEANSYLDAMNNAFNQRIGAKRAADYIESLRANGFGVDDLLSSGFSGCWDGIRGFGQGLERFFTAWSIEEGEKSAFDYELAYKTQYLQNLMNDPSYINQNTNKEWQGFTDLSAWYNTGSSIGNMVLPSLVGLIPGGQPLSSILFGVSIAGNSAAEAKQNGHTTLEAYIYGTFTGATESITEYAFGFVPGLSAESKGFLMNLFSEGFEEFVQEYIDVGAKEIILGEDTGALDNLAGLFTGDFDTVGAAERLSTGIESFKYGALTTGVMQMGTGALNFGANAATKAANINKFDVDVTVDGRQVSLNINGGTDITHVNPETGKIEVAKFNSYGEYKNALEAKSDITNANKVINDTLETVSNGETLSFRDKVKLNNALNKLSVDELSNLTSAYSETDQKIIQQATDGIPKISKQTSSKLELADTFNKVNSATESLSDIEFTQDNLGEQVTRDGRTLGEYIADTKSELIDTETRKNIEAVSSKELKNIDNRIEDNNKAAEKQARKIESKMIKEMEKTATSTDTTTRNVETSTTTEDNADARDSSVTPAVQQQTTQTREQATDQSHVVEQSSVQPVVEEQATQASEQVVKQSSVQPVVEEQATQASEQVLEQSTVQPVVEEQATQTINQETITTNEQQSTQDSQSVYQAATAIEQAYGQTLFQQNNESETTTRGKNKTSTNIETPSISTNEVKTSSAAGLAVTTGMGLTSTLDTRHGITTETQTSKTSSNETSNVKISQIEDKLATHPEKELLNIKETTDSGISEVDYNQDTITITVDGETQEFSKNELIETIEKEMQEVDLESATDSYKNLDFENYDNFKKMYVETIIESNSNEKIKLLASFIPAAIKNGDITFINEIREKLSIEEINSIKSLVSPGVSTLLDNYGINGFELKTVEEVIESKTIEALSQEISQKSTDSELYEQYKNQALLLFESDSHEKSKIIASIAPTLIQNGDIELLETFKKNIGVDELIDIREKLETIDSSAARVFANINIEKDFENLLFYTGINKTVSTNYLIEFKDGVYTTEEYGQTIDITEAVKMHLENISNMDMKTTNKYIEMIANNKSLLVGEFKENSRDSNQKYTLETPATSLISNIDLSFFNDPNYDMLCNNYGINYKTKDSSYVMLKNNSNTIIIPTDTLDKHIEVSSKLDGDIKEKYNNIFDNLLSNRELYNGNIFLSDVLESHITNSSSLEGKSLDLYLDFILEKTNMIDLSRSDSLANIIKSIDVSYFEDAYYELLNNTFDTDYKSLNGYYVLKSGDKVSTKIIDKHAELYNSLDYSTQSKYMTSYSNSLKDNFKNMTGDCEWVFYVSPESSTGLKLLTDYLNSTKQQAVLTISFDDAEVHNETVNFINTYFASILNGMKDRINTFDFSDSRIQTIIDSVQNLYIENDSKKAIAQFLGYKIDELNQQLIDDAINLTQSVAQSNSLEMKRFTNYILIEAFKADNPYEAVEKIKNIFEKNNLPVVGKVYKCFEVLHPNFEGFDFDSETISPVLEKSGNLRRKVTVFSDLIKASFGSNNKSVNSYLDNIEFGQQVFEQIKNNTFKLDNLTTQELNELITFRNHLATMYENTMVGKYGDETFVKSDNLAEDIINLARILSPNGTLDYNLGDRLVDMFCGFAGFRTVDQAKEYISIKVSEAEQRNIEASKSDMILEEGDLVKGIGGIKYLGAILQNGSVAKEYLGASATSDSTPLDTDLSIVKTQGTTREMISKTVAESYGPIFFILKNDSRFETTRTITGLTNIEPDSSKLELFYTGKVGKDHYGIRTGFASSEINYIAMDNFDYRVGLEIAKNGFYIPVTNLDGKVVFTYEDYTALRQKMSGLDYYGNGQVTISDNLLSERVVDTQKRIIESIDVTRSNVELVNSKIKDVLIDAGIKTVTVGYNSDLSGELAEIYSTGSTSRGTNVPGDSDFDYLVKIDREIYFDKDKLSKLKNEFKEKLGLSDGPSGKVVGVITTETGQVLDVEISFCPRTDKVEFSTDVALSEKLNAIKEQDPIHYEEVLANIVTAKEVMKEANVYKSQKSGTNEGGLGGIGIENWILQHNGSLHDAAVDFLEVADTCESFEEFKNKYFVFDLGENHYSDKTGAYPHENFVYEADDNGNLLKMTSEGFEKMKEALRNYLDSEHLIETSSNPVPLQGNVFDDVTVPSDSVFSSSYNAIGMQQANYNVSKGYLSPLFAMNRFQATFNNRTRTFPTFSGRTVDGYIFSVQNLGQFLDSSTGQIAYTVRVDLFDGIKTNSTVFNSSIDAIQYFSKIWTRNNIKDYLVKTVKNLTDAKVKYLDVYRKNGNLVVLENGSKVLAGVKLNQYMVIDTLTGRQYNICTETDIINNINGNNQRAMWLSNENLSLKTRSYEGYIGELRPTGEVIGNKEIISAIEQGISYNKRIDIEKAMSTRTLENANGIAYSSLQTAAKFNVNDGSVFDMHSVIYINDYIRENKCNVVLNITSLNNFNPNVLNYLNNKVIIHLDNFFGSEFYNNIDLNEISINQKLTSYYDIKTFMNNYNNFLFIENNKDSFRKFYDVFSFDVESQTMRKYATAFFYNQLASGRLEALNIMNALTQIKLQDPYFKIIVNDKKGAYYSSVENLIHFDMDDVNGNHYMAFFHEVGHCLFDKLYRRVLPNNIMNLFDDAQKRFSYSPFLSNRLKSSFIKFDKQYSKQAENIFEMDVRKKGYKSVSDYVSKVKANLLTNKEMVNRVKDELIKENPSDIKLINSYSEDTLAKLLIDNEINKIKDNLCRNDDSYVLVSGMKDHLFFGNEEDLAGRKLPTGYGHNYNYFHQDGLISKTNNRGTYNGNYERAFNEMFADYLAYKFSPNKDAIKDIRAILGDELVSELEKIYQTVINYNGRGTNYINPNNNTTQTSYISENTYLKNNNQEFETLQDQQETNLESLQNEVVEFTNSENNSNKNSITIKGANLGDISVEYKKLSKYNWTDDEEVKKIIKNLEVLYSTIEEKSKEGTINLMTIDDEGNVVIPQNALNHKCSNSIESLQGISNYGILASEWFGELESEREGCFCTFLSRMKGSEYPYFGDLAEDDKSRLNIGNNVLLFFDDNNPLMKYLLHLDYFEFEHQKQNNPNYTSLYTSDELKILEELIEPLSPAGKDMRHSYDFKTNYWSAIPGGIPSKLINGICVKNNNYSEAELDEISNLFPNAVIFDSNKKVLRYPLTSR